jgi:hypothetical protein
MKDFVPIGNRRTHEESSKEDHSSGSEDVMGGEAFRLEALLGYEITRSAQ